MLGGQLRALKVWIFTLFIFKDKTSKLPLGTFSQALIMSSKQPLTYPSCDATTK